MTKETAEAIVKAGEEIGVTLDVLADYSGRGMFGRTTYAIVGWWEDVEDAIIEAGFGKMEYSSDSMGKSDSVYY